MLRRVLGVVGAWLFKRAAREFASITDEQLRAIARGAVGAGSRPFSVVLADARAHLAALGVDLGDDVNERLVNVLADELARVRIPGQLVDLADRADDVTKEFDRAEARGRLRVVNVIPKKGDNTDAD